MSHTPAELKERFWKALEKDRTAMLSCPGVHARPMTALIENGGGPIWFFTAQENDLAQAVGARRALDSALMFASKSHDLFATVGGKLRQDNDRAVIDRLWNPFIAAWFQGGKDDPTLRLLRFEPAAAEIWLNESSLLAGIRMLLGADPKKEYRNDVAKVRLASRRRA